MAPLPSNNTAVLFVDYSGCGENHTLQIRFAAPGIIADAMGIADGLLAALGATIREITITGARVRAAGSNVTIPVAWTGAATYGSGAGSHNESAYYVDFVGRSVDGRRCRVAVFCVGVPADATNQDFRLTRSESGGVDAALTVLEAGSGAPVSISGLAVSWHQYGNIGTNAYWRNQIR